MEYSVEILSPYFDPINIFLPKTDISAARGLNRTGTFTLKVPSTNRLDKLHLKKDTVLKIYRIFPDGYKSLLGNTWWFLRKLSYNYKDKYWELTGHDTIGLLQRYLVAATRETDFAEKTEDFGLNDYASNLIRAFLRENIGNLAVDPSRDLSAYITLGQNDNLGAVVSKEASFAILENVCADLCKLSEAQNIPLYFDLLPKTDNHLYLVVKKDFLGVDRTIMQKQVLFDPNSRTLEDAVLEWDWTEETTRAYVGGDGEGAGKLILTVDNNSIVDKSPFYRTEKFFDHSDVWNPDVLLGQGKVDIKNNSAKMRLYGSAVDVPWQQFGKHYLFGDRVALSTKGFYANSLVDSFSVQYSNQKEKLSIKLSGEMAI